MLRDVLGKTLRDARRALAWWSLGLAALAATMTAAYPSVRDNPDLNKLVEDYPEALRAFLGIGEGLDYTSAVGYLNSELFSFMVPLLLIIAAVGAGARATAAEEEQGTLDLLLANPVSRARVLVEKLAALCVELVLLAAVLLCSLLAGVAAVGMHVSTWHVAAATVDAAVLALVFGSLALLAGAATGRRSTAAGLGAAAAVAAYLLNSLAQLVGFLEPLRPASPFYHYAASEPLTLGLSAAHVGLLLGAAAVAAAAAVAVFDRRDLSAP